MKGTKERNWIYYNYYDHEIISSIDFHSGITWYSKELGFDGENKVIKIGCDYMHLWDEGKIYYVEEVERDAKTAIESFRKLVKDYKYRCIGNGKNYDLKNGSINNHGSFVSNEWLKAKEVKNG